MRTVIGFLVSPLVGVLIPVTPSLVGSYVHVTQEPGALFLLLIPISIAYISAALFGIPLYKLFKRCGWLRFWQVVVGSTLCALPFFFFQFFQTAMIYAPIALTARWLASILVVSTVTGITFWAIALRQNNEL